MQPGGALRSRQCHLRVDDFFNDVSIRQRIVGQPYAAPDLTEGQFHFPRLGLHHSVQGSPVADQCFPRDGKTVFRQILPHHFLMGLGLQQQRVLPIRRPRCGLQDREDRLPSHPRNGNGVHLRGADPGKAIAESVFNVVRTVERSGHLGPLQRAGPQIAGHCSLDLSLKPQPCREIAVIGANVGQIRALRHPPGDQPQPGRQFQRPHGLSPFRWFCPFVPGMVQDAYGIPVCVPARTPFLRGWFFM